MATAWTAKEQKLADILDGKTSYFIPKYQRAYRWKEETVEELWDDLIENYKDQTSQEYLLGPIVALQREFKEPYEIVDGQQRLVTLILLFCAFRDAIKEHSPEKEGTEEEDDENDYCKLISEINKSIKSNGASNHILIELNNSKDDSNFRNICNYKKNPTESKNNLLKNYNILFKKTKELCNEYFENQTYRRGISDIKEMIDAIKNKTSFVFVDIRNEDYVYHVFRSLNSTGEKLNQSDLIKSYLLNVTKNDNKIQQSWEKLMPDETITKDPDDFLYYSKLSRIKQKEKEPIKSSLYKIIKSDIKTSEDVCSYVTGLESDSKIFEILKKPEKLDAKKTHYHAHFVHTFYGIQQINAKYFHRPIIAACREWGFCEETRKLIDCLLKFFFMYRTVCKLDIDRLKKISKDITHKIHDEKDLDEIFWTILKNDSHDPVTDNIDKQKFIEEFAKSMNDLNAKTKTYILHSIEHKLQEAKGVPISLKDLQIEHIFPKKPDEEKWENKEELSEHKDRLGNLTLLDEKWNPKLSNSSFDDKLNKDEQCYSKSGIELTSQLTKYAQWDIQAIEDREEYLIEMAKQVWDLEEYLKSAKQNSES